MPAKAVRHPLSPFHGRGHGYKEHAHLLGSIGVELPEPLFDTKLAGYLVHPDFHADTLEQACRPISFVTCTSKHKPKPRHRGPWTSTSLKENDSKNDELILTRTAIVVAFGRIFGRCAG